jgi:hypothetical protein
VSKVKDGSRERIVGIFGGKCRKETSRGVERSGQSQKSRDGAVVTVGPDDRDEVRLVLSTSESEEENREKYQSIHVWISIGG